MDEGLNVKVGDEVIYHYGSYMGNDEIATVTKVTPTGRIRIDKSSCQFDKYGIQMGDVGWRGRSRIYRLTPEKRYELIRKKEIEKCKYIFDKSKNSLTFEQAVKILKILNGEKNNE